MLPHQKKQATETNKSTIDFYNQHTTSFLHENDMSEIYSLFLENLPKNSQILDIGPGHGKDTIHFLENGYDVVAIEPSVEMAKIYEQNTNIKPRILTVQALRDKKKYRAIWANASLLHVSSLELPRAFRNIERALLPNGRAYMSFIYGTRQRNVSGMHFTDINEKIATQYLKTTSLSITKLWHTVDQKNDKVWWLHILAKS